MAKDDQCDAYEIIHINGIRTQIEDARENLRQLSVVFGNAHNEHLINYGLAYNRTDGTFPDLRQSFAQLLASYPGLTYREWLHLVFQGIWPDSLPATAVAEILGTLGPIVFGIDRPSPYDDVSINSITNDILRFHRKGRLVLVPHSQGNIYANLVYERLTTGLDPQLRIPPSRMGIVGVAVPTERLFGSYLTSQLDGVINLIRNIAAKTLPANVTLEVSPLDTLGHSFIQVYLLQLPSRNAIVAQIGTKLDSLQDGKESGTWGPSPSHGIYGAGTWHNCVPGTSSYPCPNGKITGANVYYGIVGVSGTVTREGAHGEILGIAESTAAACVAALVSARIARVSAGGSKYFAEQIPNCAGGPLSYQTEAWAWLIYSSDAIHMRLINPIAPASHHYAEARVSAEAMCR